MESSTVKESGRKVSRKRVSEKVIKKVTEDDIRNRAYEIYMENGFTSHSELDNWFRAERELKGNDYQ